LNQGSTWGAAVGVSCEEITLVHAYKNGDGDAFEQLVKRYDSRLLRIAQHITHNREDAQDAVQEAFLKAFRNLNNFCEDSLFSTWLIRITVNESLMKLRKQCPIKEIAASDIQEGGSFQLVVADWAPNPEELYTSGELRDILRDELQKLQPALRVVFVLRDIEEMSTHETAEILQLTTVAVKSRLCRARMQLSQRLTRYFRLVATASRS
jgi:RNA polymerase sigma-70 factor (ECF subfamily)